MFLGMPYVWGGRSSFGLDCSALVQLALQAAGLDCPRDSDMQEAALGETLTPGTVPKRGDLLFWKGHVGIVCDSQTLLHATAHGMQVISEPLSRAIARIVAAEFGDVTRHARLDL
ncbi:MAG: NlpC/P60 family protein, partial [Pseudomonadota bacterium]